MSSQPKTTPRTQQDRRLRSPGDLRIWLLARVFGWPGRKIAAEVGTSQPTVVRTLARLDEDPPTEVDIHELMITAGTPPDGLPVLLAPPPTPTPSPAPPPAPSPAPPPTALRRVLAVSVILLTLAVCTVLVAIAVAILQKGA